MKNVIYLAGQISPLYIETYRWREEVEEYFYDNEDYYIINPCRNSMNKKVKDEKIYAVRGDIREKGIDIIVPKDRLAVKKSTIGLFNLNIYDEDKESIGTMFELAWYYDSPEKAVIAFANDLNTLRCKHPFVEQAVTTWTNNLEEACDIITTYYSNGE